MGSSGSVFSEEELTAYQDVTYLTSQQILRVYERFTQLADDVGRDTRLPKRLISELPELRVNPFRDRIADIFSPDGESIGFEDLLDMMSVFCEQAPPSIKLEYAFRIYDFDEDDMLSEGDIATVVRRLTRESPLDDRDMKQLVGNIMKQADLDDDGLLSYAEFEHAVYKAPDLIHLFKIRM
ncbi:PREDICTED: calcium and integrin-binding protein 1-like [Priapulus caudatus]|uniref:Calcium and integrin-binding protein 1-like n=1 Tax=Priapulus caudatus TaxID=37621 RepID=A0ABM1F8U2_PRICU|nr:PREDICTED: calcium and integrin-binding protein 1-like [Priapulus caudatus]